MWIFAKISVRFQNHRQEKGVWIWELFAESVSEKKRKKRVRSIGIPLKGFSNPNFYRCFLGGFLEYIRLKLRYLLLDVLYNIASAYNRSSYSLKERAATRCPSSLIGISRCFTSFVPLLVLFDILHSTRTISVDTFGINLARSFGTRQTDVKKLTIGVTLPAQTNVD